MQVAVVVVCRVGKQLPVRHTHARLEALKHLPECDLLLACASLPFVAADAIPALWQAVITALRPGGVLAIDLFGDKDDWARGPGTFLSRPQVDALLDNFEIISLDESERDDQAFSGPKHWHTYRILAVAKDR